MIIKKTTHALGPLRQLLRVLGVQRDGLAQVAQGLPVLLPAQVGAVALVVVLLVLRLQLDGLTQELDRLGQLPV